MRSAPSLAMSYISHVFEDSAEYKARKETPFRPPKTTAAELRRAIPAHLFQKSTRTAAAYVTRNIALAVLFYKAAIIARSHPYAADSEEMDTLQWMLMLSMKGLMWSLYWFFQSLSFAGFWCLSHEAGHGTLSSYKWFNHAVGFTLHTFLLVPYYAWQATHKAHHNAANSVERDENFVPRLRSDYSLPPKGASQPLNYREVFEETPLYTLGRMLAMQLLGWQAYLLQNTLGSPAYPAGTNHFFPSSPLFKPHHRHRIIISNIGLAVMFNILVMYAYHAGPLQFTQMYFIPYLLANHWIVMLTFLHHTDPTIPHYRAKEWTWIRGTLATVDRPLLGPLGRFFLYNVSHDHIAHHLFSNIPFYNQPEVTKIIKETLQEDYNYDSTNSFRALYRSFTECCFIEDEGDIVFYNNKSGVAQRKVENSTSPSRVY